MTEKGLIGFVKRNSSTILTYCGVAGVCVTAVLAATQTPKALRLIDKAKDEKGEELTKLEKIKAAIPAYISTAAIGVSTIACIAGANILNKRTQASLASVYALVTSSYNEYKCKVKEIYGEDTHEKIMTSIAVEKAKKDHKIYSFSYIGDASQDFEDANEETRLFYDSFGDRYFESTISRVLQAEYHLNRNFMLEGCQYLNDFYEFLGIEKSDLGKQVGWSCINDYYWIDFNHYKAVLEDGLECYVIEVLNAPTADAIL